MSLFGSKKGVTANVKAMLREIGQFIKWIPPVVPTAFHVDEEMFALLLSGISTCRVMPGIPEHMDYEWMYVCDTPENAALARAHLHEKYGIVDLKTLIAAADEMFHAQEEYEQFETFWSGRPLFRANELPLREKEFFQACKDYAERLRPFVSHRGFFAWDCNEKIGLYRKAYACGIIDEERFWTLAVPLTERALAMYDGWKSYAVSCLCGAAYFMYCAQNGNDDVLRFVDINRGLLEHLMEEGGVWGKYCWYRPEVELDEIPDAELPELEMLEAFSEELSVAGEEDGGEAEDQLENDADLQSEGLAADPLHGGDGESGDKESGAEDASPDESEETDENEEEDIDIGIVIAVEPGHDIGREKEKSGDQDVFDPLDPVFDRFGEYDEDKA